METHHISLNREFAFRHLGVAILFAGLSLYFLYDAVFVYPNLPPDGPHHTTVEFQYTSAALLMAIAAIVAAGVLRTWRATLSWTEQAMEGNLVGNRPASFADVESLDTRRWRSKGILAVKFKDGRRLVLDTWHHAGARELAERLLADHEPAPTA